MAEEMVEEYMSSLKDLTINSKPFISMLTMLAEENSKYAPAIVQAIESHIEKVSPDVKLPILYLIDSIVKNVSSVYVPLFTKNIVQIFASAFEKVDEKTRMSMFKLRQTWNDIFPAKKLYTLDLRIQHIDQNWPISSPAPTSIHVNPKFLNRNVTSSDPVKEVTPPISGTSILSSDHEATILKKQQILQELQQQKRDLELLQQKVLFGDSLPQAIVRPVLQEEPSSLTNPGIRHMAVPKLTPKAVVIPPNPSPAPAIQTAVPKAKIAPVNSILIEAARSRDPRLARMQAAKKPEVPKNNESEKKAPTKSKHNDDPVDEILRRQRTSALKTLPKKLEKTEREIPEAKITEDQIQQRQMAMLKAPVLGQINRKGEVEKSQRKRQFSPVRKSVRDRHESPKRSGKDSPSKSRSYRDSKPKKKGRDKSSRSDGKSEENKPERLRDKNDKSSEKDDMRVPEVIIDSSPKTDNGIQDPRVGRERDRPIVISSPEPPSPPTIGPQTNTEIEVTDIADELAQKKERVGFKAVKASKSRNYSRRNKERSLTPPPAPSTEESATRKVLNAPEEIVDVGKDVDLRLLVVGNKKRTSTDGNIDGPPSKRGKEDDAIQLFGNKDMDERLPPGGIRTPPPPVISDASSINSPSSQEIRSDTEGEVKMDTSEPKDEALLEKDRLIRSFNRFGNEADNAKKLDDFIITAKEQLKRGIITPEEYNRYMQKVVQTTEDEKIKIAQKRRDSFIKTSESEGYERIPRPNFPFTDFRPKGPWRSEEDGPPFGRKRRGRGGFGPRGRVPNEPHWRDRDHRYKPGGGNSPDWLDQDSRSQDAWMNMGDITIPPADPKLVEAASDPVRHISIDGTPRAIRFYGNTAVVMLSFSDARQISFENGVRRVFIAGFDIPCQLNGPPMQFFFQQEHHTVRLGAPTRELYVNERYYEVQFGGPMVHTELVGVPCTIQLEGPPPQVRIAPHRTNLCLGSVLLIVDARSSFPIYLDAKPQRFSINGRPLVLRFTKQLSMILINDVPVPLMFGGSPVPINFLDRQHFLRLTELPLGIIPGRVNIRGMDMELEGSPHNQDNNSAEMPILQEPNIPPAIESQRGVYMDLVSSMMGGSSEVEEKVGFNYKIEPDTDPLIAQPAPVSVPNTQGEVPAAGLPILQNLNITDLFQSLVASGIIPKQKEPSPPPPVKKDTPQDTNLPALKPIRFDDPNSLKMKQPGAHLALYSGIQCGSCGIRFHPNDTQKYSQHLDWHFRQNRRGRDALRHGSFRRWYYEIKDWKEFNEIEESEDRAQSWFETEAQNQGSDAVEEEQPSEPAPRGSGSVTCHVCHDRFDTFFHEETEEWHLKNCISADGRFYHPACHKDAMEISETEPITAPPLLEPLKEERPKMEDSVVVLDVDDDDPDDGMDEIEVVTADDGDIRNVVNQLVERVIMEEECEASPIDDDELEVLAVTNTAESREPIAYIEIEDNGDDDDYTPEDTVLLFDPNKKIKTEPVDEMESPVSQVDQTLTNVISSIDGNIELSEAPVAPTSVPSKIKITFTKPAPVLAVPEPINDLAAEPIDPNELQIEEIVSEPLPIKPKKPRIAEKVMKEYPPCLRGNEMSGLCNIM